MNTVETLKNKRYNVLNTILFAIAFLITTLSIFTGSYVHDKVDIQVGMISPERYTAPRDMVDAAATEKKKEEARSSVGPLYKHDTQIQNDTITALNDFFVDVEAVLQSASEVEGVVTYSKDSVLKIPVALNEKQYKAYGDLTDSGKSEFKKDVTDVANYAFDQGITEESMTKAMELVSDKLEQTKWNAELKNMGYLILSAVIKPNMVLDEEAMNAAREQKASEVADVLIYKNQKIVDEGELITQDIYRKLDELNLIDKDYGDNFIPMLGSFIVVCLLFAFLYLYFKTQYKKLAMQTTKMLILFVSYLLTVLILRATSNISLFSIVPLTIFAMLVAILVDTRVAVDLNLFVSIIGLFIFNGNLEYVLYFTISGSAAALFMQYTKKRNHIFIVAVAVGAVNFVTYTALGLFIESGYSAALLKLGVYAAVTGILAVIIVVGSLPIWEAVFDVNTPLKLLELTNPTNELMRRLMIEAPGTYHHCLLVANLAETACYDIEADATLARVGAYYHDIGKLKYPLYFGENQAGDNPHDNLDPYNSARIIKGHVKYGLTLAEENNLPKSVKSFIREHHGTTLVKFFYYKAVKQQNKEAVDEADFRYAGPVPQSKETAVVMLADTVEAAVRSNITNGKNMEEISGLIKTLIKDKLDDGQLDASMLTLTDLDIIRKSFLKVFQGMYHNRIAYPKMEELKEKKEPEGLIMAAEKKAEEKKTEEGK